MDLGLKKINKISELKAGKTYIVSTKDISKAIKKQEEFSLAYMEIVSVGANTALMRIGQSDELVLTQKIVDVYMHIYDLKDLTDINNSLQADSKVIELQRKIRKLENKNAKLDKLIRKNGIELIQHEQPKKQEKKQDPMIVVDTSTIDIFGYPAYIIIRTNHLDKIQVSLTVQPGMNSFNGTVVPHKIIVTGLATKHKDDEFNYKLGKQLAYSRAINKLMERIAEY